MAIHLKHEATTRLKNFANEVYILILFYKCSGKILMAKPVKGENINPWHEVLKMT